MRRPITRVDAAALRRALAAVGLDPDYWSHDDISEMERWGYGVDRMVDLALRREGKERQTA
jgi:hypothetical protein